MGPAVSSLLDHSAPPQGPPLCEHWLALIASNTDGSPPTAILHIKITALLCSVLGGNNTVNLPKAITPPCIRKNRIREAQS